MNNKAFTLIELLVVVLIIGILAAVALPQYKIAVAKSRTTQLLTLADATRKAEEIYYLANGQYTRNWEELSVDIAGTVTGNTLSTSNGITLTLRTDPFGVTADDSKLPIRLLIAFYYQTEDSSFKNGKRTCSTPTTDSLGNSLCQHISNSKTGNLISDGARKRYWF